MMHGRHCRLGREQSLLQQGFEQNASHLARAQNCHSFCRKFGTHSCASVVRGRRTTPFH
jgi:hypothetical protein